LRAKPVTLSITMLAEALRDHDDTPVDDKIVVLRG
jgi:hypothetical protein